MKKIHISHEISNVLPGTRLGCIQCAVRVRPSDNELEELSQKVIADIREALTIDAVSLKPTIKATKDAYRKLGKDPSRYRPSAEALTRRIVNGKTLYRINNVVDTLNLISLKSGFSIGGYDADKIEGEISFGVGKTGEPYEAIGRGAFNIENLPVFRDAKSAFGSPTSDSVRTMVTDDAHKFLMIIIDFAGDGMLEAAMAESVEWLKKYSSCSDFETMIVRP